MYHVNRLPPELSRLHRWIPWRLTQIKGGGTTKKPGVSTKTGPWSPLDDVLSGLPENGDPSTCGPGLVLTGQVEIDGKRLFALDLDGCRNPATGDVHPWAEQILGKFPTYAEVSPSGTGLRIFGLVDGDVPRMRVVKLPGEHYGDHRGREIQLFGYGAASYVTVTGERLSEADRLIDCSAGLGWLARKYPSAEPQVEGEPPTPVGRAPTVEELDTQIRLFTTPTQDDLIDTGDFAAAGLPSASEGWFVLIRLALQHCAGHIDVAERWLIDETAYGRGEVEDSKDPARYSSPRWVQADLLRIHGKARAEVQDVFSPVLTNGSPALSDREQTTVYDAQVASEVFTVVEDGEAPAATPPQQSTFFELVDVLMARDPRPNWLIHGVLEANCLAALSGAPGSLKSFTALDICFAMASAQDWHGKKTRHAPVLYLAGEGHGGLSRRARAWFKHHEMNPAGVRLAISKQAAQFLDDKAFTEAAKAAHEMATFWNEAPGLIVIDTLNRNFGPGDENSTEDMTKFIARCDDLRRKFPGCTVLIVHHTGWGDSSRGRGSSALRAAMDTDLMMHRETEKKGQKPPMHTRLSWAKMKDAEEPDPLWLMMKAIELGVDDEGETFGSLVVERITTAAPTAAATSPLADPGVQKDIDTLLAVYKADPERSVRDVLEDTGMSRRRRADTIALLEEHGLIEVAGQTNARRYEITALGEARLVG